MFICWLCGISLPCGAQVERPVFHHPRTIITSSLRCGGHHLCLPRLTARSHHLIFFSGAGHTDHTVPSTTLHSIIPTEPHAHAS